MITKISRHWGLATVSLLLLAVWASLSALPATSTAQSNNTTFSGQAAVVRAKVLGIETVLSDTGALDSAGGAREASLLESDVPGLVTAEALHASTVGQGDRSRSEASVANVNLTVGGNNITADFLMARAEAVCGNGRATPSGSSEIADLVINSQAITVGTAPNQTVDLPNGKVIVNEQTGSANGRSGDITVNALH